MDDLINRQAAIDAILHITNCKSVRELFEYNQAHHLTEMWSGGVNDAIDAVIGVESATDKKVGTTDTISRQAAIDALKNDMASLDHIIKGMSGYDVRLDAYVSQRNQVNCDIDTINNLPTAQPEELDTLIKALEQEHKKLREMQVVPPEKCEKCMMEHIDEMEKLEVELEMQKAQPEIIYCKDCKYRGVGNYCVYGTRLAWITKSNDFCSYAERRTDERSD